MGKYKGNGGNEKNSFRQLINSLELGEILFADRYDTSYFLIVMLMDKGLKIIFY